MKQQAIIYARQSSGSDDYSESVSVQIINCQILADRNGLEVIGVYSDLNISGKTFPVGWEALAASDRAYQNWLKNNSTRKQFRSGLGEVIKQLARIDYIIVDDITRLYRPLTRSYLESAVNQALIENNVQILQVKGGKLNLASFDQQLVTMLKNQINDEQIAKQRQRSIEVLDKLRDSGIMPTGITAFGLIYNTVDKTYRCDQEKAEIIQFIFREVIAMRPYCSIIREVNTRWAEHFNGCFWEKTFREILRKPIYAGYQYNSKGDLIVNHQGSAIITLDEFLQAQQVMQHKRTLYSARNCNSSNKSIHYLPLSGYLYCGCCGSKLVAAIEKGKVAYFCRRGTLRQDWQCRQSRISVLCTEKNLYGLLDTVQAFLGYVLLAEAGNIVSETFGHDLLTRYRKNKLTRDEFALLLNKSELKLTVKYEKVEIRIKDRSFTVPRKRSGRQTGFSATRIRAVRRELAGEIEQHYLALRKSESYR